MKILVCGGTGYIGSHTTIELLKNAHDVVIIDNLSNSKLEVLSRIEKITGIRPTFHKVDILNRSALESVFAEYSFDAVIHFAGLKAVGESVALPLKYYENNINGSVILFETMQKYNVKNLVFSSSATVYGFPDSVPISEDFPLSATNPYGRTKLFIEEILRDLYVSDHNWSISILRYFNPIGAHESATIGEDPNGIPNNLMPFITQVAVGKRPHLNVFGNDYPTPDGTGVRDYIHVVDLAIGHLKAIEYIKDKKGVFTHNLGTGIGYSVLDMVKAFEKINNINIPYNITERRPGDVAECYANPEKAKNELNWKAEKTIEDMCKDSWLWQKNNPEGYN
jgi:UDP-glucose 4-epimerase